MANNVEAVSLTTPAEWAAFAAEHHRFNVGPFQQVLDLAAALGAQSAIVERNYLDQDFTAEFSIFYSKLFRRHNKVCKRLHFFRGDVGPILQETSADALTAKLQTFADDNFLGFVVLRPVAHSPLAKAILSSPPSLPDTSAKLLIRATYKVHLLGAEFRVEGVPLVQQDTRIGSCAQAAIWVSGRHFHTRHKGGWYSMAQVSEEALKPADFATSLSLPAGSQFLGLDNMVRALRSMGREPFTYIRQQVEGGGDGWPTPPHAIIARYIDSGIPVILGMKALPDSAQQVGHALVTVGHVVRTIPNETVLPSNPTRAEFSPAFLVNDDQRGIYQRVPVKTAEADLAGSPYRIERDLQYLLIPLPSKVFLTGESAEQIAWQMIRDYGARFPALYAQGGFDFGTSKELSDQFIAAINGNQVLARTYLTYGWKYKARLLRNICAETVKQGLLTHDLPKYVWVTEFGTLASTNTLDIPSKRIFAHVVIDATSSHLQLSQLFFHAPGMMVRWSNNAEAPHEPYQAETIRIKDDRSYHPKVRGKLKLA